MTTQSPTPQTVFGKLTQPIIGLIERCNSKRKCHSLTDHEWIETGILRMLSQEPSGSRKREHDTRALKRLDIETLRQSAPKGRKVIYVWDRAGIDFFQWFKWKHLGGIYFISREKKNMDLMVMGDIGYRQKNAGPIRMYGAQLNATF